MISEFGLRIYRVSVGEAERFPSLAQEYYESGPMLLRQQLITYLEKCVRRGELQIPDLDLAADQLIELAGYMRQHYVEAGDWWDNNGLPGLQDQALPDDLLADFKQMASADEGATA